MDSVFSYVKSYIPTSQRNPQEDYLTQIFAWMLNNVDGLLIEYCKFLVRNSATPHVIFNDTDIYSVETQYTVPNGRIDMLIKVDQGGFIIEHKIDAFLSENQLTNYTNSREYIGSGKFYTVLITRFKRQHTQYSDIKLTWNEIHQFMKVFSERKKEEEDSKFMLSQFSSFLVEQGLANYKPIDEGDLTFYFKPQVVDFDTKLNSMFNSLDLEKIVNECPGLINVNPTYFGPKFTKSRWGRKGIDFFTVWEPGIFAGILMTGDDHRLPTLNESKGPDFVVFVEYEYKKSGSRDKERKLFLNTQSFVELKNKLQLDHGSFDYLPGLSKSPWRVLVLRKSFSEVIPINSSFDEQLQSLQAMIISAINIVLKDNLLVNSVQEMKINQSE